MFTSYSIRQNSRHDIEFPKYTQQKCRRSYVEYRLRLSFYIDVYRFGLYYSVSGIPR